MDGVSLHLLLNDVPMVGTIGALLLLGWGLVRRSCEITAVGLGSLIVIGLVAIPVFITGQQSGQRLASVEGLDLGVIAHHRDAAVAAMIGLEAAAITAAAALVTRRSRKKLPFFQATCTLVIGIAAAALLVRAAMLGGQIRHSEARTGVSARR